MSPRQSANHRNPFSLPSIAHACPTLSFLHGLTSVILMRHIPCSTPGAQATSMIIVPCPHTWVCCPYTRIPSPDKQAHWLASI